MSSPPSPQRIGPAKGGRSRGSPQRHVSKKTLLAEFDRLNKSHTIDPQTLRDSLSEGDDTLDEEDSSLIEALKLSQEQKYGVARERAEEVLESNPANALATYVTCLESESRQDWSEAARFFLMGLSQNPGDHSMEHGFQTNLDMLRAVRNRWINDRASDKWEDVLSFKPKERKNDAKTHIKKPPWWRLGPLYEAIVQGPDDSEAGATQAYVVDLLSGATEPDEERMELRRVIYQNMDYLNILYAYYQADMAEDWPADKKHTVQVNHDGHDGDPEKFPFGRGDPMPPMQLKCLWRMLKDCGVIFGDVRIRFVAAVINRIHVQGRRRTSRKKYLSKDYEVEAQDPHDARSDVEYYDWIETLIRVAACHTKMTGSVSQRFESLIKKHLRPNAMRKLTDKSQVEYRSVVVQDLIQEPSTSGKVRRIFEYFISSYKSNKIKVSSVGPRDLAMSFNHVLFMMEKLDDFDPSYNVKRCWETFQAVTCDSGLLPQEHPNNQNSEMVFEEFCEFLSRSARIKGGKGGTREMLRDYLDNIILKAGRIMPGKN